MDLGLRGPRLIEGRVTSTTPPDEFPPPLVGPASGGKQWRHGCDARHRWVGAAQDKAASSVGEAPSRGGSAWRTKQAPRRPPAEHRRSTSRTKCATSCWSAIRE